MRLETKNSPVSGQVRISCEKANASRYLAKTNPHPYGLEVRGAEGDYLLLHDRGEDYQMYDMSCGISVNNLGHRHRKITEATQSVESKYAHLMVYGEFEIREQTEYAIELAQSLTSVIECTRDDYLQVWFTTSGTEANELAMKLSMLYTGRDSFYSVRGGFHGRTLGSLALTTRNNYRKPFMPLVNENNFVAFDELKLSELWESSPPAGVVLELIRGEDGVREIDTQGLATIQDYCNKHKSLMIVDEVQTGFGRTGKLWASQHYDIKPDIVCLGKAAGGGYPLGAVVARKSIFDSIAEKNPFTHLSTFGGNPIACAAGRVMLREVSRVELLENVKNIEEQAYKVFQGEKVLSLRGKGAMLGLEINTEKTGPIDEVIQRIWDNGVFVGRVLHDNRTIRLYPPLNSKNTLTAFNTVVRSL